MSNADFYMQNFANGFEDQRQELWNRFVTFYEREYDQFQNLVSIPTGIHDVFLKLKTWPLKLVIASNPMFPLNVQLKRLAWAQLGDITFDLVTHIENMTFCKPRLEYYLETCEKIETPPQACLMVGNDPINDIIVTRLGMKTFLTLDGLEYDDSGLSLSRELRNGTNIEIPTPDFQGHLADLPGVISQLLQAA
jgi:FMN phosphatase YigB (HAD superfamily)